MPSKKSFEAWCEVELIVYLGCQSVVMCSSFAAVMQRDYDFAAVLQQARAWQQSWGAAKLGFVPHGQPYRTTLQAVLYEDIVSSLGSSHAAGLCIIKPRVQRSIVGSVLCWCVGIVGSLAIHKP